MEETSTNNVDTKKAQTLPYLWSGLLQPLNSYGEVCA